jgi:catechol 2,3-dioxygenase-like lactoylglutathione lyase family enzyme
MRQLTTILLLLACAVPAVAQLPAANEVGVSSGHMHMMVRDPEAHKKIWTEVLGGQLVKAGTLELIKLPGIFLVFGKAEPAEGSEGSSVDHFAFRAKDLPGIRAKLGTVPGITFQRDDAMEVQAVFPDKVKIEFYNAPTINVPLEHFHAHLFTTDVDGLRAWYVKHLGATTQGNATRIPGMDLSFRKTDKTMSATKGRSLDHIGFEVKGLEAFVKKLQADGVTIDSPYRDVPAIGLKIAFIVDPAGTRIELTEGLADK